MSYSTYLCVFVSRWQWAADTVTRSRHLGGEKEAKRALGLTSAQWGDLSRIANREPIKESRHRRLHPIRRPVIEEEQTRALEVARRLLRAHLDHVNRQALNPESAEGDTGGRTQRQE
jgi:hypothetical protein